MATNSTAAGEVMLDSPPPLDPSYPPPPPPPPVSDLQYIVPDTQVLNSLYFNMVWGALCIFGFVVLRGWLRGVGGVFQRREELYDLFLRPPRLVVGRMSQIWNWVLPLLSVSDADIIRCGGFDVLMLTRVLLMGLQTFTVMTVIGVAVLIPVYFTQGAVKTDTKAAVGSLSTISMANVPVGSSLFWLPFVASYIFVGHACFVLYLNCKGYAHIRSVYFTCLDALPAERQLMDGMRAEVGQGAAARSSESARPATSNRGPVAEGTERAEEVASPPPEAPPAPAAVDSTPACVDVEVGAGLAAIADATPFCDPAAAAVAASSQDDTPVMPARSFWLNIADFANPQMRMMLDYMDWMGLLQRAAAAFGVRRLRMPIVRSDEPPHNVRQYATADHLPQQDDKMLDELYGSDTSAQHGGSVSGHSDSTDKDHGAAKQHRAHGIPAVLPYWRPATALARYAAPAPAPPSGLPVPALPKEKQQQLRRRCTGTLAATSVPTALDASGINVSITGAQLPSQLAPSPLKQAQQQQPGSALPSVIARLTNPLQPLLVGKRNVRLQQLLQVPVSSPAGGTEVEPAEPAVRVVNARHYVVLIKRVHMQTGPSFVDRWGAVTFVIVHAVRLSVVRFCFTLFCCSIRRARSGHRNASDLAIVEPDGTLASVVADRPGLSARVGRRLAGARVMHEVRRYMSFYNPYSRAYDRLPKQWAALAGRSSLMTGMPSVTASELAAAAEELEQLAEEEEEAVREAKEEEVQALDVSRRGGDALGQGDVSRHNKPSHTRRSSDGGSMQARCNSGGGGVAPVTSTVSTPRAAGGLSQYADPHVPGIDVPGAAVDAVLRSLYPSSFIRLVPVVNHDPVDRLVFMWDAKMLALGNAERDLAMREAAAAKGHDAEGASTGSCFGRAACCRSKQGGGADNDTGAKAGSCACAACHAASVEQLRAEVLELERKIEEARKEALDKPLGTAYFAMFNSSKDAQALAQCKRVVPPQGPGSLLSFDACPAPAPDDVSWPSLWSTSTFDQYVRRGIALIPLVAIFILPIGVLQGILANLDVALCSGAEVAVSSSRRMLLASNKLFTDWFCDDSALYVSLIKLLLTGVLPSIIGLVWSAVVMPHVLYLCSSIARTRTSLSAHEREMQTWFFWYSLINTFLGAMLGGGVFSQIGTYLEDPTQIVDRVGKTLPNTANFFIQFCIARAVFTNFLRFIWPHAGSMLTAIFRSILRCCRPRSLQASSNIHMIPSTRAASYYNAILQVMMFGWAYAAVAPIILPVCWCFFFTGYFAYRYSVLYIYERSYESGGRMFPVLFDQVMGFCIVLAVFTGAVFITNQAWVCAIVMWCTLIPFVILFWRYCHTHYLDPVHHPPLTMVAAEPHATVDPLVYMPPALRPGAIGWYPEQGKVWEKYGIPKHYP